MRLDEVTIGEFKNLRDLHVDFDETSPYTVLVGENGAGKSNLIEALTYIFRNLDLELDAPFDYHLRYRCRGHDVEIRAKNSAAPQFWVRRAGDSEFAEMPKKRFMELDERDRPLYRPAFVFGYYSGPSDRLALLYERHRERYYTWIIKPRSQRKLRAVSSNARRRLFYAQNLHGQFALLAFYMGRTEGDDDDRAFLREHLQIDGLDSVLFALKRPPWRRTGGNPHFWNAEGEVREFLEHLYAAAVLPARMNRRIPVDLTKNPSIECLYLFLPRPQALEQVFASYQNQYAFFTALESTHISKVLAEVRTRVRMTPEAGGGEVTYRDLSEGEQQLLLVLGLLKFTAEDEALFLLDEPDTHLNPVWSTQYLDFLNRFIPERDSCHIIMSTHDPLVFSRLLKRQVRVFHRDATGAVRAEAPLQDPRGMGVQAILTSDLFRLRSTLDPETQHDLDVQRRLAQKEEVLTPFEEAELRRVTERLHERGFWTSQRDPLYALFLKKWAEREQPTWTESVELTPDQIKARESLASEIVAEIAAEEAAGRRVQ
jgi:predicted ATPase